MPEEGGLYIACECFGHILNPVISIDELFVVTCIDVTKYIMHITCFSQRGKRADVMTTSKQFGEMTKRVC
jgi:hypothetical protein